MYFRAGTGSGLIVYFFGGGLVWDEESARGFITAENLFSSAPQLANGEVDPINEYLNFAARKDNGLFSSAPDNPFADWSVAAINYGTGDFHVYGGYSCRHRTLYQIILTLKHIDKSSYQPFLLW